MFCPCADSRWHESPGCVTGFSLLWWTRSTWWQPQQISSKHNVIHHITTTHHPFFSKLSHKYQKKSPIFFSDTSFFQGPIHFLGGVSGYPCGSIIFGGFKFLLDGWFFHEPNLPQVRFIDLGSAFSFESPESLSVATPEYMPHEARTRFGCFLGPKNQKNSPGWEPDRVGKGGRGNFHIFLGGYQGSCKFQRKFEGIFPKMRGKLFGLVSCHMTPCLDQVIGGHQLRMMKTKNHQWWIEQMTRNVCSYSTVGLCWINSSTIWQIWRKAISKSPRIEASVLVSGYVMFDWLPLLVEKVASKSTLLGYWKIPGCWVTPRKEGSNPPIPMCFFFWLWGDLSPRSINLFQLPPFLTGKNRRIHPASRWVFSYIFSFTIMLDSRAWRCAPAEMEAGKSKWFLGHQVTMSPGISPGIMGPKIVQEFGMWLILLPKKLTTRPWKMMVGR